MGAKNWMAAYFDDNPIEILKKKPKYDKDATYSFIKSLYEDEEFEQIDDGDLLFTNPPDKQIFAASFPGLNIVAAKEFGIDYPSKLPQKFIEMSNDKTLFLHAMHSVVDWFAFAIWEKGTLKRSLSLSPDNGIMENIGEKQPFEIPFWEGNHSAIDPDNDEEYSLPFHPLDLGEAAMLEFLGYQFEGSISNCIITPEEIPIARYNRKKKKRPIWKFW